MQHDRGKMWKKYLFHATDFKSLIYPCFIFCRILGICPYKLKALTFEASKPYYIVSIVVSCVYIIFNSTLIYNIIILKINFGDITKNLQITSYYIISGFIVIMTHVLSGARMRLLQIVLEISSKLPTELFQKLSRLIHIKDILAIILKVIEIYIIFYKKIESDSSYFTVLDIVFTSYSALMELQINMLYMNCVCILKTCFKNINDNLAHMQILLKNSTQLCDPSLIYHVQRSQFLLTELRSQKKQHMMVSDAVQILNATFNLQLLAIIIVTFSNITFDLYFYAVHWQDGIFISFNLDIPILDFFLILIYNAIKIILLVWICEISKNQAQEIVTTVHDLLNSTNNEQIKKELQLFSLQILHRKNAFSAIGLTVDATFFVTIIGTITTYLLILVQFLNISHSCKEKTAITVIQSN